MPRYTNLAETIVLRNFEWMKKGASLFTRSLKSPEETSRIEAYSDTLNDWSHWNVCNLWNVWNG